MSDAEHWDRVYTATPVEGVSWFQPEPGVSLRLLHEAAPPPCSVVDVGAGASLLPDRLLAQGWTDVTVLDVSERALAQVRARPAAVGAQLVEADVLTWRSPRRFDAWHDRAVFHFLTSAVDRARYLDVVRRSVVPGGVLVLGVFAEDGPTSCSGLPTERYDAPSLSAQFGPGFTLEHTEREEHLTPWGAVQPFTWVVLRDRSGRPAEPGTRAGDG